MKNQRQKDRYRMKIQERFYSFYQLLIVNFRMRYIYLDRLDALEPNLLTNRMFKEQKKLFLDECEKLDQERSI